MAWITEKPNGFMVRWRDADTGRTRSRTCQTPAEAQVLALDVTRFEQRAKNAERRIDPPSESSTRPAGDASFSLASYLRRIIRQDAELTQSSRETYGHNIRNHIDGTTLGASDIRSITPEMIRAFWTEGPAGKGVGVRRNVLMVLSKGFTHAVLDGELAENPLRRARIKAPSKNRREEVVPLSVAEVEKIAESALHENIRLAILTMAYGGLRAGEVCGLRLQDVDFARCALSIRRQVVYTPGKGRHWTQLKTEASRRTVTIPSSLAEELKVFVRTEPPAEDGRIFHGTRGRMLAHQTMHHGVSHAAKIAGIEGVFPHRFRHTAVALLIDDGASPKAIQAFCGHSKIGITLDTYGHLFDYGGVALAESMERRREQHRADQANARLAVGA